MSPPETGGASAMSEDVANAVRAGQERCRRIAGAALQHRYELAIDKLLRHPLAIGEPELLLNRALAHARSHLRRRAAIIDQVPYSPDLLAQLSPEWADEDEVLMNAVAVVAASPLPSIQRGALLLAIADAPAARVASRLGLTPARARERLARARARARACPTLASLRLLNAGAHA